MGCQQNDRTLAGGAGTCWSFGVAENLEGLNVRQVTKEMTQPCLTCIHVISLVAWWRRQGFLLRLRLRAKEMMQPCLTCMHDISLIAWWRCDAV